MSEADGRYELTTTLSLGAGSADSFMKFAEVLERALVKVLSDNPAVTAYFAAPDPNLLEIKIGLRFEGMPPRNIEGAASHVLDEAMQLAGSAISGPVPVREESTLVPA